MPGTELRKFVIPEFVFGEDSRFLAGQFAENLALRKVMLVTDEALRLLEWPDEVARSLRSLGIEVVIFSEVSPNPRDSEVMKGADKYVASDCDGIVVLGGGSPIDCAKAIGIVATNGQHVREFEGVDNVRHPGPPLLCIPTTSGSAADISQFCIISDTQRKVKFAIISKTMIPDASLIDPRITTSMSAELTAHTGLDALTHAIEAYVSNASSPITDLHALEAIRLVKTHLVTAVHEPGNMEARSGMALASTYAGMAFSNAILGAVHAMAHSLGGRMDLPHGLCNAILLDHVIDFNFSSTPQRYREIAQALGEDIPEAMSDDDAKAVLLAALKRLKLEAGVSATLAELGVTKEQLRELAQYALQDPCILTNPKTTTIEEIERIYVSAR